MSAFISLIQFLKRSKLFLHKLDTGSYENQEQSSLKYRVLSLSLVGLYISISLYYLPESLYSGDPARDFSRALDYALQTDLTPLGPKLIIGEGYIPVPFYFIWLGLPLLFFKSPYISVLLLILLDGGYILHGIKRQVGNGFL